MNPSRRRFLFAGAATLVAAPAIVRVAANLMPVSAKAFESYGLSPMVDAIRDVRYVNRTVRHWLDIQALRDRNVLQTLDASLWYSDGATIPIHFRGFEALKNAEAPA